MVSVACLLSLEVEFLSVIQNEMLLVLAVALTQMMLLGVVHIFAQSLVESFNIKHWLGS